MASKFVWYELMTSDMAGAEVFYTVVLGWASEPMQDMPYTTMKVGDRYVAGVMAIPEEAARMGQPPAWLGYIHAVDVDAATESLRKAGGTVHREPNDIPNVGRFSVVADPQGAAFMLFTPFGDEGVPLAPGTPGTVGWRELYATDWKSAFDFYASQFGWTKGEGIDMGEMGTYQLFHIDGEQSGGMMNKPADMPVPAWGYYFNVEAIDAAAARVTEKNGKVISGPMQVPGGSWILNCIDPQGAMFSLVAPSR